MARIIASLTTSCGPLQMFSLEALEMALSKISTFPTQAGDLADETHAPSPPPVELLDGFTINQWAAYAKLKSQVASRMCHENGLMKRKLANLDSWRSALPSAAFAEKGDPLFVEDPWQAASSKLAAPRNCAASTSASTEAHLWADWSPDTKQHDIGKEPASVSSDVDKGSSCLAAQCCPGQDYCSSDGDNASSSATGRSHFAREDILQLKFLDSDPSPQADALDLVSQHAVHITGEAAERKPKVTVLHVEWPAATDDDELSMDDVVDYFEGFGQILGTDMPECPRGRNLVKLDFVYGEPVGKTLQLGRHVVTRADDGKKIAVKVYAKLDTRRKDAK